MMVQISDMSDYLIAQCSNMSPKYKRDMHFAYTAKLAMVEDSPRCAQ